MALEEYRRKRNFKQTPEPSSGRKQKASVDRMFVVQEHHASTHHFDFRLEADGVLKSWAVPKGPSMDPADRRLAVQVEDHPLSYAMFSGDIPIGNYGAGHVEVWDHGTYRPEQDNVSESLAGGKLSFTLKGKKLKGKFVLLRMRFAKSSRQPQWLLVKQQEEKPASPLKTKTAARKRPPASQSKLKRSRG